MFDFNTTPAPFTPGQRVIFTNPQGKAKHEAVVIESHTEKTQVEFIRGAWKGKRHIHQNKHLSA